MDKGAGAIAIIALLIGGVGVGLFGYTMIQAPEMSPIEVMYLLDKITPQSGVQETWYKVNSSGAQLSGSGNPSVGLQISFTVKSGESVLFSVSGYVSLDVDESTGSNAFFITFFYLDGVKKESASDPICYVDTLNDSRLYFGMQNFTADIPAGSHTIDVVYSAGGFVTGVSSALGYRTLLVQTIR